MKEVVLMLAVLAALINTEILKNYEIIDTRNGLKDSLIPCFLVSYQ